MNGRRLVVIGAGPTGLAAALGGLHRKWDVTVLEGGEVGEALRQWGPTRFFSPVEMNLPPGAHAILGPRLPKAEAILTGPEFVDGVLLPLAGSNELRGRIRTGHRVIAVGRAGLTRFDYAAHPLRAERPFRLLVEASKGETIFEADAVLDTSGVYGQPAALGGGGIPAPGERSIEVIRHLGKLHEEQDELRGRRVLLVGSGHSAANAIVRLRALAEESPETTVVWAVRSLHRKPCIEAAGDPLPERRLIVSEANNLAAHPPSWLKVERRALVESIQPRTEGQLRVELSGNRVLLVHQIIGLTGYRPDLSILAGLAIDVDAVTEGVAKLAGALRNITDCLSVPRIAPADIDTGEPRFHIAGSKSYGRANSFLLKNGYAQLETMLDRLDRPA